MEKPYPIIDMHTHIFPDRIAEKAVENIGRYYQMNMSGPGTVQGLIDKGSKIGVAKYVIHSSATQMDQVKPINDYIYDVVSKYTELEGFGTLHPHLDSLSGEIDRIIAMGLKGVKLHPEFQSFVIDEQRMFPVYEALEGRLPILMHMGDVKCDSSSPIRLTRVLDKFPRLIVIAAHFGGYRMWDDAKKYLIGRDIYMDTSSSLAFLDPHEAVQMIRSHGVDRFLFGTDYPMWDHEQELQRFLQLDLNEQERKAILYDNSARLFNFPER